MKRKAIVIYLTLLIAGTGFATGAAAGMYKWTDKEGNVHYTQSPPAEGRSKEIAPPPHVNPPASTDGGASNSTNGQGDGKQARTKEQEESDKINCTAAQANLNLYQGSDRYRDTSGKVVIMDEAARKTKIEQAQEQVKRFCH